MRDGRPPSQPPQKGHQRENAPFPAIIETQGDRDIFQRGYDDQRPQDQRQRAEDCPRLWLRAARHLKHRFQRIERTCADVAKHHSKGGQAQCRHTTGVVWDSFRRPYYCLDSHYVTPPMPILNIASAPNGEVSMNI